MRGERPIVGGRERSSACVDAQTAAGTRPFCVRGEGFMSELHDRTEAIQERLIQLRDSL